MIEVRTLLQGLNLPRPASCTSDSLPEPRTLALAAPPSATPEHVFPEPRDTVGEAYVRPSQSKSMSIYNYHIGDTLISPFE